MVICGVCRPEVWAVQGKLQDELKAAQFDIDDGVAHAADLQLKLGRSEVCRSVLQRKLDERDIDIAEVSYVAIKRVEVLNSNIFILLSSFCFLLSAFCNLQSAISNLHSLNIPTHPPPTPPPPPSPTLL